MVQNKQVRGIGIGVLGKGKKAAKLKKTTGGNSKGLRKALAPSSNKLKGSGSEFSEYLVIKNARENNLKNVSLSIPRNALTVVTGISGSGKSSLAFDTILKEGQRRYISSLSAYARQYINSFERADVDSIEGLSPTISIEQKSAGSNPRSTVGTVTEVFDFLRLFFARLGTAMCPHGHGPISNLSIEVIIKKLYSEHAGEVMLIMAALVRDRKGEYRKEIEELSRDGFMRMLVDGKLCRSDEPPTLKRYEKHSIEVIVDRLELKTEHEPRLREALRKAASMAEGSLSLLPYASLDKDSKKKRVHYSEEQGYARYNLKNACKVCGTGVPEMEPRLFSFNSPEHWCGGCRGLGHVSVFEESFFIRDEERAIFDGALFIINADGHVLYAGRGRRKIEKLYEFYNFSLDTPWQALPDWFRARLIHGRTSDEEKISERLMSSPKILHDSINFFIMHDLNWVYDTYHIAMMDKYRRVDTCGDCGGSGLSLIALSVKFDQKNIHEFNAMNVDKACQYFKDLAASGVDGAPPQIWKPILREINERLTLLKEMGLGYLTLNRKANTLSGGESQRIRLASQIGSGLEGCLYVLDEPSIGLHPEDNLKIISALRKLRDKHNTLIVVEHDEDTILSADYLVEIGPGAGAHGGYVNFSDNPLRLLAAVNDAEMPEVPTANYILGKENFTLPKPKDSPAAKDSVGVGVGVGVGVEAEAERSIKFSKIKKFNLKNLDMALPLGKLIVITGVSGSGKSTLVDVLSSTVQLGFERYAQLKRKFYREGGKSKNITHLSKASSKTKTLSLPHSLQFTESKNYGCKEATGLMQLKNVVLIEQKPIGRSSRSNPATYTRAWNYVRDIFAALRESKIRGYTKSTFSFNVSAGRCENCKGHGVVEIDMQMFSKVETVCEVCNGKRFHSGVLSVLYKQKSIYDILEMYIGEAVEFFDNFTRLKDILKTMMDVGLHYIKLGQSSSTLSGGEAQRIKLASELSRSSTGENLYFLDEPSTGLHFADVSRLMKTLHRMVQRGDTVVVIEHNMEIIKCAEHVIELGRGGGEAGGSLIVQGSLQDLIQSHSSTGKVLEKYLKRQKKKEKGYFLDKNHGEKRIRELFPSSLASNSMQASGYQAKTLANGLKPVKSGRGESGKQKKVGSLQSLAKKPSLEQSFIEISGLKTNNLKNISLRLPKRKIIAFTGVSGSGKTSIVLESIFFEGQRRYLESLSTYARRFLGRLSRVDAERMENLSPTICVDRKRASANPRSTVATQTELYDYFRVLYSSIGEPHCPSCDNVLQSYTTSEAAKKLCSEYDGKTLAFHAPLWQHGFKEPLYIEKKAKLEKYIELLLEKGYSRFTADGLLLKLEKEEALAYKKMLAKLAKAKSITLVLDRLKVSEARFIRVLEAMQRAYELTGGLAFITEEKESFYLTKQPSCMEHVFLMKQAISPRDFSFNHHQSACRKCHGLGESESINILALISDVKKPILGGAYQGILSKLLASKLPQPLALQEEFVKLGLENVLETKPYEALDEHELDSLLYGSGKWQGLYRLLEAVSCASSAISARSSEEELAYAHWRSDFFAYSSYTQCTRCAGGRLEYPFLKVKIQAKSIYDLTRMSLAELAFFFKQLPKLLSATQKKIVKELYEEICFRLKQMVDLGLDYLSLNRKTFTLSGGELERIRLSTQMGSRLSDVIYVLDEPSVGLHEHDCERLLTVIRRLKDLGNTVLLIEHSGTLIKNSDFIVDVGPEAGEHGGNIMYAGPNAPDDKKFHATSFYSFLYGDPVIEEDSEDRKIKAAPKILKTAGAKHKGSALTSPASKKKLSKGFRYKRTFHARPFNQKKDDFLLLKEEQHHNIKNSTLSLPLGRLIGLSGVSGAGKSSLLEWFVEKLRIRNGEIRKSKFETLPGTLEYFEQGRKRLNFLPLSLTVVDQKAAAVSKRFVVASYVAVMDSIREVFLKTRLARQRGYSMGHFSFNVAKGYCPRCRGIGEEEIEMHFLSDISVRCEECQGKRYKREILDVFHNKKNIFEVLQMTVSQAFDFFYGFAAIRKKLQQLLQVGLGYLNLGLATSKLSSGEVQRLKIARELAFHADVRGFYILDEPTTGLHFKDIQKLLGALDKLLAKGASILVIEHNIEFLRSTDYLIDMGPGAGKKGGEILAFGSVEQVKKKKLGKTWLYL